MGTNAHGAGPISGRSCSIHPIGLAQRSQPMRESESAAIRTRYDTVRIPPPMRLASWRVEASWDTSTPTAMNMTTAASMAVAK